MSYWSHFVKVGSGVFWSTCPTRCCGGSSSSGVGGSRVGPMATTFNFYQELVRNTLLMHQSLSLFSILSGIATTRTWRLSYCSFRSILHKLARSLENRVNSVKETKHLSRSERKQRRRRHARYAFHVRLKNIREECEAENSEERRAAARATLERERRAARAAASPYAHLYLQPSMKYTHPTPALRVESSRVDKQPRLHFRVR